MLVWAMPFVILGVGALKQWFTGDLSDTIRLQTISSITTSLDSLQIYTGYLFTGYLTRMQRGVTRIMTIILPSPSIPHPLPSALGKEKEPRRPNSAHPHRAFCPAAETGIYNQNCLGHRLLLVLPAMLAGCSSYKEKNVPKYVLLLAKHIIPMHTS